MDVLDRLASLCLWVSLAAVVYAYAGYPLLIWALSRAFGRRYDASAPADADLPPASLLIAAHNEEAVIEERILNALALDYPADKLQVVVACDGCVDATPRIVARYADRGVRLLDFPQRRGKSAALNAAFPALTGDIVLLTDANTHFDTQAARRLARWFRNPDVGAVCGRLVLTDPVSGRNVDGLYWKYETFLKTCEGKLGALLGANGAIYAIRRAYFRPIPADTIIDDFVLPLQARQRTGCAIVYDKEALAHEESPADVRAEFHRRSRIGAGGFQSIALLRGLLHPRQGWVAFTFLSHKLLRWLGPFLLMLIFAANVALARPAAVGGAVSAGGPPRPQLSDLYRPLLLAQLAFYGLALAGAWLPGQARALKPLRLTTLFVSMNAALLAGFWRWLRGTQKPAWKRTPRAPRPRGVADPPGGPPRPASAQAPQTVALASAESYPPSAPSRQPEKTRLAES